MTIDNTGNAHNNIRLAIACDSFSSSVSISSTGWPIPSMKNHLRITTNMMVYRINMQSAAVHTHKYSVMICSVLNSLFIQHPLRENRWSIENKTSQENTWLTVPRISIIFHLHVNDVGDSDNEGGKNPYYEDHELRDIIWCPPAEDKHTEGMYSNGLFMMIRKLIIKEMTETYQGPVLRPPDSAMRNLGATPIAITTHVIATPTMPICLTTACAVQRCPSVICCEFKW